MTLTPHRRNRLERLASFTRGKCVLALNSRDRNKPGSLWYRIWDEDLGRYARYSAVWQTRLDIAEKEK